MPKQGLASVTLDSWADSNRCFIFSDLFPQKVGEWYLSEERRSFCRSDLNPPKGCTLRQTSLRWANGFSYACPDGIWGGYTVTHFLAARWTKTVHTGLLVVMWKVRHHSGTIGSDWQVRSLDTYWLIPFPNARRASLWSLPSNVAHTAF